MTRYPGDDASPMAFGELIGARVVEERPEQVVCEVTIGSAHLNQGLIAQGGVMFTLADVALGLLMNPEGDDATWVSTSFDFQLFRAAGVGDTVRAAAVVEHASRSLRACRVTITRQEALVGTLTNQAVRLPVRDSGEITADRLRVRRADGDGPLDRALAAARRRRHGDHATQPGVPVAVELDAGPIATAVLGPGGVDQKWLPTHLRGTEVETQVDAALSASDASALGA